MIRNGGVMEYIVKANGMEVELEIKRLNDDIIDRLVAYRKKLHMTQQDIADITGIKRANIARIESKKHEITIESLIKYASSMGLDLRLELQERK